MLIACQLRLSTSTIVLFKYVAHKMFCYSGCSSLSASPDLFEQVCRLPHCGKVVASGSSFFSL